jgi:hypothetical protein
MVVQHRKTLQFPPFSPQSGQTEKEIVDQSGAADEDGTEDDIVPQGIRGGVIHGGPHEYHGGDGCCSAKDGEKAHREGEAHFFRKKVEHPSHEQGYIHFHIIVPFQKDLKKRNIEDVLDW